MATPEMTRSEEENASLKEALKEVNHSLKVHQEYIDFILHKDEIRVSFQQQYDDVVHDMSNANAARLYMDG